MVSLKSDILILTGCEKKSCFCCVKYAASSFIQSADIIWLIQKVGGNWALIFYNNQYTERKTLSWHYLLHIPIILLFWNSKGIQSSRQYHFTVHYTFIRLVEFLTFSQNSAQNQLLHANSNNLTKSSTQPTGLITELIRVNTVIKRWSCTLSWLDFYL